MNHEGIPNMQSFLEQALSQGIAQNAEQEKIWLSYKKSHEQVAEALKVFQKDLKVNCMVPIGKRAFMKGSLIHTNEILVSLGADYFVKYSADQAVQLCNRRIESAQKMLKDLEKERDLYELRMLLSGEHEGKDITEHWEEKDIDEWRVKHREREKEYRQKLMKEKEAAIEDSESEEDFFRRLDELEIEEELEDYEESEDESESSSEDVREILEEELRKLNEIRRNKENRKSVMFDIKETDETKEENEEQAEEKEDEDLVRIEFSHSQVTPKETKGLEGPGDILKFFSTPKSILKKTDSSVSYQIPSTLKEESKEDEEEEDEEEEEVKSSAYEYVMKDIKERDIKNEEETTKLIPTKLEDEEKTKKVSKFRRERSNRK